MSKTQFATPFSAEYWRLAYQELKKPRILVFAALIIALRVALKSVEIPVGPYLNITVGFFVNSLGSMVYGPVVAILAGAISDTIGCMLFPKGAYFFPFIFLEIASSLIFALYLYRAKLTTWRVILSRFSVMVICNLIMTPSIMILQNRLMLGGDYAFFTWPRLIKNLCLFPAESFLLVIFLNIMVPITGRMGLTALPEGKMLFTKRHLITLIIMALVSAAAVAFYAYYKSM